MSEIVQLKTEITPLKKADVYREFILWTAMPYEEKKRLGLETQGSFCEHYNLNKSTPSRWKERPDFESRVDAILKMWSTDRTPEVVQAIYRAAVKGNPLSQKLWLQYFKGFTEKSEVTVKKVEIGVNDIRFLIEAMPEPIRTKFYGYIREIIDTANALRNARQLDDRPLEDKDTETALPRDADHDAQDASSKSANVVAKSNSRSIRTDMVGQTQSSHHKSTPRRWQE